MEPFQQYPRDAADRESSRPRPRPGPRPEISRSPSILERLMGFPALVLALVLLALTSNRSFSTAVELALALTFLLLTAAFSVSKFKAVRRAYQEHDRP